MLWKCTVLRSVLHMLNAHSASLSNWADRNAHALCRLRPKQKVGENLYRRGDGTLCYFFSTEDLEAKAKAAGFVKEECSYVCVQLLNRRKKFLMRRVFVHGVFRKPKE